MNSTSVQIALRPVLNDDVSGIIAKYYYRDMFRERRNLLNSLHFELLRRSSKTSFITYGGNRSIAL